MRDDEGNKIGEMQGGHLNISYSSVLRIFGDEPDVMYGESTDPEKRDYRGNFRVSGFVVLRYLEGKMVSRPRRRAVA